MDTDALIKLTKASAKETVASNLSVFIPPEVRTESVDQGKEGGFPDAARIAENIGRGLLATRKPRRSAEVDSLVRDLQLTKGEAEVLRLFRSGSMDLVVSDDRRFLHTLDTLGIPYATSSSLLVALTRSKRISTKAALAVLDKLARFISDNEYVEARKALEEG